MNQVTEVLIKRLQKKGIAPTAIPGFLRSVMITVSDNPPMSLQEINRRLHVLGWDSFEMDDHTLQLITASLEAEGLGDFRLRNSDCGLSKSNRLTREVEGGES